jgi:guanylate kinase
MLKCITVTGPSCSGKTTLVRELLKTGDFCEIVSYTSRAPRTGEVEGKDYYFRTVPEMLKMQNAGEFIEIAEFKGNVYATSRAEVEAKFASGKTPIVILEPHGLSQFASTYGNYDDTHRDPTPGELFAIYIENPRKILVERFLRRFLSDKNADPEYYISRINGMLDELEQWPAHCARNITVSLFTEDNKESIVKSIHKVIKEHIKRDKG